MPTFRGLDPFRLTDYMKLEPYFDDLTNGDFVLVVFTVGRYRTASGLNKAALNIQLCILLAKREDGDCTIPHNPFPDNLAEEMSLGVDDTAPMEVPDGDLIDWADSDIEIPSGPQF